MKNLYKIQGLIVGLLITSLNAQVTYERNFENVSFDFTTEIQFLEGQNERVFVVEQPGRIKVFPKQSDVTAAQVNTFLNITNRVRFINGQEMGLLGLAFHPQYESNGYFYVYYTADSPVQNVDVRIVVSRFSVDENNPNQADPDSELVLFRVDKNQSNGNHNGGKIAFGPDGYLYFSVGDGGGGNDPRNNAQNKNNVFGSICRIDIDLDGNNPVEANPAQPNGRYEIPSDNPFPGNVGNGLDEIFAYGIRNTWKFSFDEVTGRLWGADVGQQAFEEVNIIEKGKNYGWKRFEGNQVSNGGTTIEGPVEFPVHVYPRGSGNRSITGGYVYRGSEITSLSPDIQGKYIFGDYVSGRVWVLNYNPTTNTGDSTLLFRTDGQFISSFGVDSDGEHYFSDYGDNAGIYKLKSGTNEPSGVAVDGIGSWEALEEGINGTVQALATGTDGQVYYGGSFSQAGTATANNIAVWNPSSGWSGVGSGSNGAINSIVVAQNGDVYAAGAFTEIGGIAARNVARWNGTNWSALGDGLEGPIAAMALNEQGDLYVGGIFETVRGIGLEARNIAVWNGSNWSPLQDATTGDAGMNNEVRSLAIGPDGTLYAGGNFDEAGGKTANRIATWDGSSWGTLGDGTSGFVEAIAVDENSVFVGGNFALAGSQTVNRVAQWNLTNQSWSALGEGLSNSVSGLLLDGNNVYACGSFSLARNTSQNIVVNNIARYDTTSDEWIPLGKSTDVGVDILVNAITFDPNNKGKIYVGGNFNNSGAIAAKSAALWSSDQVLGIGDYIKEILIPYPNPTDDKIVLSQNEKWSMFDIQGKFIAKGESKEISLENYPKGVYLLSVESIKEVYRIVKK